MRLYSVFLDIDCTVFLLTAPMGTLQSLFALQPAAVRRIEAETAQSLDATSLLHFNNHPPQWMRTGLIPCVYLRYAGERP